MVNTHPGTYIITKEIIIAQGYLKKWKFCFKIFFIISLDEYLQDDLKNSGRIFLVYFSDFIWVGGQIPALNSVNFCFTNEYLDLLTFRASRQCRSFYKKDKSFLCTLVELWQVFSIKFWFLNSKLLFFFGFFKNDRGFSFQFWRFDRRHITRRSVFDPCPILPPAHT